MYRANHRNWICLGSRQTMRMAGIAMLMACGAAEGQLASTAALQEIGEIADRVYEVRKTYREKGTLAERMKTSVSMQYCHVHEGGLKGTVGYDLETVFKLQQGGGEDIPAEGVSGAYNIKPKTAIGLETAGKLTGRTSFCVNLHNLGDGWAQVAPLEEASAFEEPYVDYVPPGETPDEPLERRSIQSGATSAGVSSIADLTPVDILNTLVAGYVGIGLDPADVDQVRALLMGPDVAGLMNDLGNAVGGIGNGVNPAELPLAAAREIGEYAATLSFLEPLAGPFDALTSIDSGDDICNLVPGVDMSGACDLSQSIVDFAFDDDYYNIVNFPSFVQTMSNGTADFVSRADSALSRVNALETALSPPRTHIEVMYDKAKYAYDKYRGWENLAVVERDYLATLVGILNQYEANYCRTFANEKMVSVVSNGMLNGYCAVDYTISPCSADPTPKIQLQCDWNASNLETLTGDAYNYIRELYDDSVNGIDDVFEEYWPKFF